MVERLDQWPRVHSCLYNWCSEKKAECERCDAVCRSMIALAEAERKPFTHTSATGEPK